MLVCLRVLSSLVGRKELSHAGRGTSLRNCGAYETRLAEGGWKFINAASLLKVGCAGGLVLPLRGHYTIRLVRGSRSVSPSGRGKSARVFFFFLVACFVVLSVR